LDAFDEELYRKGEQKNHRHISSYSRDRVALGLAVKVRVGEETASRLLQKTTAVIEVRLWRHFAKVQSVRMPETGDDARFSTSLISSMTRNRKKIPVPHTRNVSRGLKNGGDQGCGKITKEHGPGGDR